MLEERSQDSIVSFEQSDRMITSAFLLGLIV